MKTDKKRDVMTIVLAVLTGVLIGLMVPSHNTQNQLELTKLDQTFSLIERHYVDALEGDSLSEQMIEAMLSTLDPHSRYLSASEMQREETQLRGRFYGIGIILHYMDDTTAVHQIIPGGPSEGSPLRVGDRIVRVDTTTVAGVGMKQEEIVQLLRGRRGTRVTVSVRHPGEEGTRHITLTRGNVETPSITCHTMLDAQTGYIQLTQFIETSADEFRDAIADLKEHGMRRLVLDLRNNSGGLLSPALSIADELLPGNELMLYTEGAHQRRRNEYSHPGGCFCEGDLIVMIDEYSASASEIIAGTIQDNDRGLVVGRRSFGKGLVQRDFPLMDGSALFLTTARYYTPSGRCIQRPYDKGNDEYYLDFLRQLAFGYGGDSTLLRPTDTTRYFTTAGRVVYAGGGILPDHPLRLVTDSLYEYYNALIHNGILSEYAFEYATLHQEEIRKHYPTEEAFLSHFTATEAMLQEVVRRGKEADIQPNPRTLKRYGADLRLQIKALIGQSLYSSATYHKTLIPNDSEITEALQFFKHYTL